MSERTRCKRAPIRPVDQNLCRIHHR
jgi:hypothetical protein